MSCGPHIFGVRHLSAGAGYHVGTFLDEIKPTAILIEGLHDATEHLAHVTRKDTRLPIAILAYTTKLPVRTLVYPLSDYCAEFQAIRWADARGAMCEFIDLPSDIFLALHGNRGPVAVDAIEPHDRSGPAARLRSDGENGEEGEDGEDADEASDAEDDPADDASDPADLEGTRQVSGLPESLYQRWATTAGESDYETFWERHFEHNTHAGAYRRAILEFGAAVRALSEEGERDMAETLVREAFMRRRIRAALAAGHAADRVAVICGAFHAPVLGLDHDPMSDAELDQLPRVPSKLTLMPYSYLKLSSQSGYGAGNQAPAYFGLLHHALREGDLAKVPAQYLARVATWIRDKGSPASTASVIEGTRLARALAALKGGSSPVLQDIQDAAVTCLGGGERSVVADAMARIEVGTDIGALPEGVSQTAIQDDFARELRRLKLEAFRTAVARDLDLDLRENRRVTSEEAAFLDLNRSHFLHRLAFLQVGFAKPKPRRTDSVWAESWILQWSPEAEIALVESTLRGETVELAAGFEFRKQLEECASAAAAAGLVRRVIECGLWAVLPQAESMLQALATDTGSFEESARAAGELSQITRYGDVRRFDPGPLQPVLAQLFLRGCLLLPDAASCDNAAARIRLRGMQELEHVAQESHETVDDGRWIAVLRELSDRDDRNPLLSGFACAILLERGAMDNETLAREVSRRLSPGIEADLGAGWFEGLAQRNRYALLARRSLWESLAGYVASLDEGEFRRALVFLRRAFGTFQPGEKARIAENLAEIWAVNPENLSERLAEKLSEAEEDSLKSLDDFNFDDV